MTSDRVEQFRKRLASDLATLQRELEAERASEAGERYRDLTGEVGDAADEASSAELVAVENDQIGRLVTDIREIEAAIQRTGNGSFGVCSDCGSDIDEARLEAYPSARRCLHCQEQFERAGDPRTPSL
jgi:DnaK suppressor protein